MVCLGPKNVAIFRGYNDINISGTIMSIFFWCRQLFIDKERNEQHKDLFLFICDTSSTLQETVVTICINSLTVNNPAV